MVLLKSLTSRSCFRVEGSSRVCVKTAACKTGNEPQSGNTARKALFDHLLLREKQEKDDMARGSPLRAEDVLVHPLESHDSGNDSQSLLDVKPTSWPNPLNVAHSVLTPAGVEASPAYRALTTCVLH